MSRTRYSRTPQPPRIAPGRHPIMAAALRQTPQSVVSVATTDATGSSLGTATGITLGSTAAGTDLSSSMEASSLSDSSASTQHHDNQIDNSEALFSDKLLDIVSNLVLQRGHSAALDQTGRLWSAVVLELISRPGNVIVGSQGAVNNTGDPRRAIARRRPRAARGLKRLTQAHGLIDGPDSSGSKSTDGLEGALIQAANGYLQQQVHLLHSAVVMDWATELARQAWMRYMSRQQRQGGDGHRHGSGGGQMADTSLPDPRVQYQKHQPTNQVKQQEQQQQRKPDEGYYTDVHEQKWREDDESDEELYGDDD